jgi:hypothetical protein
MNETLDTQDMNITVDAFGRVTHAFGSAPIRAEGMQVAYDNGVLEEVQDIHSYEVEVAIEPTEVINE